MVVAGALTGNKFHDKLFIRSLKTEEASASSASMLATPLTMQGFTNAQIHQCTDSPMHGFTNAQIHLCTMHYALCRDSPMHGFTNARIHRCTDSPMHRFTNAQIHLCTMHYALCRDSPMHRFTNARIHLYSQYFEYTKYGRRNVRGRMKPTGLR